ncbi:MAG TPA: glycosyl hydrolase family 28-related protein, partial [Mucilaginibacter sp.]|nr:glycosyl hydrolase family 28-related protein [Mucilaginibacter sp.]
MKRITALVGFLCFFVLFSCKKDVVTPVTNVSKSKSIESLALVTINGVTVNNDTIPPAGAVDVKTYGAVGDGITDDTQAIQNAINAQNTIVIGKGTYIINQTINMRSGVKIYGTNGATIKPGTAMSEKLLTNGRYFFFNSVSKAAITNLTFVPSSQSFNLATYG